MKADGTTSDAWRGELQRLVDRSLTEEHASPEAVAACVRHAHRCDFSSTQDVEFAVTQLIGLAEHVQQLDGQPQKGILAAVVDLAVQAFLVTGSPLNAIRLGWLLRDSRSRTSACPCSIEPSTRHHWPHRTDEPLAEAILRNERGEVLRKAGELRAAEGDFSAVACRTRILPRR